MNQQTYQTTEELAVRIKYDTRTIRNRLKDSVLIEGRHYFRPFGGRKILYIWEAIESDMQKAQAELLGMNQTQAQRARDRLISKLTEGLLLQTRIDSQGTALICWMTEKPAHTHREAMKYWALEQLQSLDLCLGHELIHPLRRQLSYLFDRIQEAD